MYKKVFQGYDKKFIFIDTEGIDALDANDTHDVRIFTLALLLSSAFLYNSMGPIDETALQTLSLMTRVTENVKFEAEETMSSDISPHMPKFYWILRDFSLKLVNKKNEAMSENQYLAEALQETSDANKNNVRDAIKNSFQHRNLITLPRPSNSVDPNSQRLEDKLTGLSKNFTNAVDTLRNRIFQETSQMQAQEKVISGKMYAVLCRHFASVVQTNAVPVIKDSWTLIASIHAKDLKDTLLADVLHSLSTMKAKPKEQLNEDMKKLKMAFIDRFTKESMKPVDNDVKNDFATQMDNIINESKRRLELNISEKVDMSLESLENKIQNEPEKLSIILNQELERFTESFPDPEFSKAWMVSASERALCRWIPRSLQALAQKRDEACEKVDKLNAEFEQERKHITTEKNESIREEQIKRSELEQLYESSENKLRKEIEENERLQHEIIAISIDLRSAEQQNFQTSVPLVSEHSESNDKDEQLKFEDELSARCIEIAELKSTLSMEKSNHEKSKRMCKEKSEKLDKAMTMQANLEQNLKEGIQNLKNEQVHAQKQQQLDFENRTKLLNNDITRFKTQIDNLTSQNVEIQHDNQKLDEKLAYETLNFERSSKQMQDVANKYREQAEQSQKRVLEIHKSMIEDLRIRDERAREQQSKSLRETAEYHQKISDTQRELDSSKADSQVLKKRLHELETVQLDYKRLRTNDREKDIHITQITTENNELRTLNQDMLTEREQLRKENMQMEGELSVLRAEKQFNDVRRTMQ